MHQDVDRLTEHPAFRPPEGSVLGRERGTDELEPR